MAVNRKLTECLISFAPQYPTKICRPKAMLRSRCSRLTCHLLTQRQQWDSQWDREIFNQWCATLCKHASEKAGLPIARGHFAGQPNLKEPGARTANHSSCISMACLRCSLQATMNQQWQVCHILSTTAAAANCSSGTHAYEHTGAHLV